jgi:hypothetical protein
MRVSYRTWERRAWELRTWEQRAGRFVSLNRQAGK